jgi:hypothetical protein
MHFQQKNIQILSMFGVFIECVNLLKNVTVRFSYTSFGHVILIGNLEVNTTTWKV